MSGRSESKADKDRQKQIQEKCQTLLAEMLRDEDNKYCEDCDAKGPRWASWNLGVFLCIRCAGIHRNLGVHISKVKSVNLDTWTPEQVVTIQQMGNSRARAVYEASLPDNWRRPQTDSSLETFIRNKYQHKKYIAKEWVAPAPPKVDWDKELDAEAERQKKKKREKQAAAATLPPVQKAVPAVKVPALPKPASSPKSSRAATSAITSEDTKAPSNVDLLGLSTSGSPAQSTSNGTSNDDIFSSFLSAPPGPPTVQSGAPTENNDQKGRSAEENNFFNQPAQTSDSKKPLSKDSILALYGSQPPPQPQNMVFSQGAFPANANVGFPSFGAPVAPVFPGGMTGGAGGFPGVNSGLPPHHGGQFPVFNNGMPRPGFPPTGAVPANPFFGMSTGVPHQFPIQHVNEDSVSKPSDDLLADFGATTPAVGARDSMTHQMAGLSLGQPMGIGISNQVTPNFAAMASGFANTDAQPGLGNTFTNHLWQ